MGQQFMPQTNESKDQDGSMGIGGRLMTISSHCAMMKAMKAKLEYIEGPEAAARFDVLVRKVLAVPHTEIMRPEAECKRKSAATPNRRGPKPHVRPAV